MKEEFITIRKFNDPALAEALADLLQQNNIPSNIETYIPSFDPTFVTKETDVEISVKIKQGDFEKADGVLLKAAENDIKDVDQHYYLFGFKDEELIEIIAKPDEWNHLDYLLSQKILKERGKEITPEVLQVLKKQRLKELTKEEESQRSLVYGAYLLAFAGGLIGAVMGWHLYTFKKTLPNGDRIYNYNENDRFHGRIIMIIGTIITVAIVLLRLLEGPSFLELF